MLVITAGFNFLRLWLNKKLKYLARMIICVCSSHDVLFSMEGKMTCHLSICYFLHSLWYLNVVEIALKLDCIFREITDKVVLDKPVKISGLSIK